MPNAKSQRSSCVAQQEQERDRQRVAGQGQGAKQPGTRVQPEPWPLDIRDGAVHLRTHGGAGVSADPSVRRSRRRNASSRPTPPSRVAECRVPAVWTTSVATPKRRCSGPSTTSVCCTRERVTKTWERHTTPRRICRPASSRRYAMRRWRSPGQAKQKKPRTPTNSSQRRATRDAGRRADAGASDAQTGPDGPRDHRHRKEKCASETSHA